MKTDEMRGLSSAGTSGAGCNVVIVHEDARHRFRLLATMVRGTTAALPSRRRSGC